jgi:hypothetical protein
MQMCQHFYKQNFNRFSTFFFPLNQAYVTKYSNFVSLCHHDAKILHKKTLNLSAKIQIILGCNECWAEYLFLFLFLPSLYQNQVLFYNHGYEP